MDLKPSPRNRRLPVVGPAAFWRPRVFTAPFSPMPMGIAAGKYPRSVHQYLSAGYRNLPASTNRYRQATIYSLPPKMLARAIAAGNGATASCTDWRQTQVNMFGCREVSAAVSPISMLALRSQRSARVGTEDAERHAARRDAVSSTSIRASEQWVITDSGYLVTILRLAFSLRVAQPQCAAVRSPAGFAFGGSRNIWRSCRDRQLLIWNFRGERAMARTGA